MISNVSKHWSQKLYYPWDLHSDKTITAPWCFIVSPWYIYNFLLPTTIITVSLNHNCLPLIFLLLPHEMFLDTTMYPPPPLTFLLLSLAPHYLPLIFLLMPLYYCSPILHIYLCASDRNNCSLLLHDSISDMIFPLLLQWCSLWYLPPVTHRSINLNVSHS